ncbi:uncharacterized protein THITE_2129516 [Thermothielavioides terrestris NRRL 8126]|uniref:Uncharacterized protein n=1 Tax=Thermothielavioides terrestris (strain ATCC 38088 / NRRL 8126) TaxID=578455 RepID=G2R6G9_THETT|nr:uncharacterized protein THITE_2129516 [Thermothielavioides terrestris NRRL 8126]AEO67654.1 hypothetical protein THITE_2129516 [Thermothielavioides terrestris NRRL 8126]
MAHSTGARQQQQQQQHRNTTIAIATTSEMPVLDQIFKTLHRLETQVNSQSNRLNAIELSIKSRSDDITASSTDDSSSETSNSGFSNHRQSRSSASSMNTPSPHCPQSPAASYRASLAELRNRFAFSHSSLDIGSPPASRLHEHIRGDGTRSPTVNNRDEGSDDEWEDEVVYTESTYSQYPSRLDLSNLADAPPLLNDIQLQRYVHSAKSSLNPQDFTGREDASSPPGPIGMRQPSGFDGPHRPQSRSPPASVCAPSIAKCASCGHQAGSEQETNLQSAAQDTTPAEKQKPLQWRVLAAQRHDRAEMALFAWECCKASSQSWWFESEEWRAIQSETRRITEVLAPTSAAAASSSLRKAREAVGKLKTMLATRLNNAGFFWARRETAVVP